MINKELIDIQMRLAYQEDMINELNTVIAKQDRILIQLQSAVSGLAKKVDDNASSEEQKGGSLMDEKPPHY